MFCNKCGKEIKGDMTFCTGCGAKIGDSVSDASVDAPVTANPKRKKQTQALAFAFATMTVIMMFLGWFSLRLSIPSELLSGIEDLGLSPSFANEIVGDVTVTATIFDLTDMVGSLSNDAKVLHRELVNFNNSGIRMLGLDSAIVRQIGDAVDVLGIAATALNVLKVFIIAAICALLLFVFLMLLEKKAGAVIGQIGGTIAFFTSIIFAVSMAILNSSISKIIVDLGLPYHFRDMLTVSCSLWGYATMALGALTVVFIAVRKNVIRGE